MESLGILGGLFILSGLFGSGLLPAISILLVAGIYWISFFGMPAVEWYLLLFCAVIPVPVSAYCAGMLLDEAVHTEHHALPLGTAALFFSPALSASPDVIIAALDAAHSVVHDLSVPKALLLSMSIANTVLCTAAMAVAILLIPLALVEILFYVLWQREEKPLSIHVPVCRQLALVFLLSLSLQLFVDFFSLELWPSGDMLLNPYTRGWLGGL